MFLLLPLLLVSCSSLFCRVTIFFLLTASFLLTIFFHYNVGIALSSLFFVNFCTIFFISFFMQTSYFIFFEWILWFVTNSVLRFFCSRCSFSFVMIPQYAFNSDDVLPLQCLIYLFLIFVLIKCQLSFNYGPCFVLNEWTFLLSIFSNLCIVLLGPFCGYFLFCSIGLLFCCSLVRNLFLSLSPS